MAWLRRSAAALLFTAAVLGAAGCSRAVAGAPVATPGEAGKSTQVALLGTTCREYTGMKQAARREVIAAIGASGNKLIATNPELWVGVAGALCTFADPGAPVRDVITGGIR